MLNWKSDPNQQLSKKEDGPLQGKTGRSVVFSAPSVPSHGGIAMASAYISINSCFFASCHLVGHGDAQLTFFQC